MALVLPVLRLWLLLLNIYGTFKAIKPPPSVQRNTRNGSGPSSRAMQLRKRELKSRLAVWVVWAAFSILEFPLDRTMGFVIPFYNEFKCIILLFLLVSRAHGAEAIFLHILHPLIRPYVPAVDDILASLNSIFELLTLLFWLPYEYLGQCWPRKWRWNRTGGTSVEDQFHNIQGDAPPPAPADRGEDQPDIRRRLRPRTEANQAQLIEAARQAQVILQNIDDAQEKVRARNIETSSRTRSEHISEKRGTSPDAVGLRTRQRVLEQQQLQAQLHSFGNRDPGSRLTGLHYLDPVSIVPPNRGLSVSPTTRAGAPKSQSTSSKPLPSLPSPGHEIWYPPQSSYDRSSPSSRNNTPRTPSPVYPPLPSAYPFTPRRSDPLPLPPHTIRPPEIFAPMPKRVSSDVVYRKPREGMDSISSHAGPSTDPSSVPRPHGSGEKVFGKALEPSIQTENMDLDTETLSTRDGSSAEEQSIGGNDVARRTRRPMAEMPPTRRRRERESQIKKGKRKASTTDLRRSTRMRNERPSSVETDEFDFPIRPTSLALETTSVDSESSSSHVTSSVEHGPLKKKKPLARTKPSLKPTPEETVDMTSSDEESVKKKRKIRPVLGDLSPHTGEHRNQPLVENDDNRKTKGTARNTTLRNLKPSSDIPLDEDRQVNLRPVRASTRQPRPTSAQGQAGGVSDKKDRGK